jgi:hypothetical protein
MLNQKLRRSVDAVTTIQVTHDVVSRMAEGLGTNWFSGWREGTYPPAHDESRWARIFDHFSWLNPRFIRFGQPASRLCDDEGRFRRPDLAHKPSGTPVKED